MLGDGRVAFAVPYEDGLLLGTTDDAYDGDPAAVAPAAAEERAGAGGGGEVAAAGAARPGPDPAAVRRPAGAARGGRPDQRGAPRGGADDGAGRDDLDRGWQAHHLAADRAAGGGPGLLARSAGRRPACGRGRCRLPSSPRPAAAELRARFPPCRRRWWRTWCGSTVPRPPPSWQRTEVDAALLAPLSARAPDIAAQVPHARDRSGRHRSTTSSAAPASRRAGRTTPWRGPVSRRCWRRREKAADLRAPGRER